ncbi:MAG TPA: efflux RND transporter periplasmic adaptor subunit, partial [Isosphaeraceae bacterium]|nr:efflux RND transporter periplasmic adaptor subunit [Isosphaeraceae bacterium]
MALVSLLLASGCGGKESNTLDAKTAPKVVPVTVAALELRTLERTVSVVGTLRGWEQVTVGSKRMGRVAKIHHDMGDRVSPGEILVALETVDAALSEQQSERRLQAELAKLGLESLPPKDFDVASVPSVVQARVSLERAVQNQAREKSLNHRGAGTAQDLQNAENDTKAAEASLENAIVSVRSTLRSAQGAKVALDLARQARIDMEIRAPVPSILPQGLDKPVMYAISKRDVSEGQMIKEGDAVAELVVENPLKLWANVPERHSSEIQVGQTVRISVAAHPGRVFDGKITRINPVIDATSRTFQVETSVPNDEGLLKPGGFAKAQILSGSDTQAKVVPLESVVKFAGVSKLFVVESDKARAIPVETGEIGTGWIEVVGAVSEGAKVVTSGQTQLADGTQVLVRGEEATSKLTGAPAAATLA